eukprot:3225195-Rhodomonas_salina.1
MSQTRKHNERIRVEVYIAELRELYDVNHHVEHCVVRTFDAKLLVPATVFAADPGTAMSAWKKLAAPKIAGQTRARGRAHQRALPFMLARPVARFDARSARRAAWLPAFRVTAPRGAGFGARSFTTSRLVEIVAWLATLVSTLEPPLATNRACPVVFAFASTVAARRGAPMGAAEAAST